MASGDGQPRPFSHRFTVDQVTPTFAANCSWVNPSLDRIFLTTSENRMSSCFHLCPVPACGGDRTQMRAHYSADMTAVKPMAAQWNRLRCERRRMAIGRARRPGNAFPQAGVGSAPILKVRGGSEPKKTKFSTTFHLTRVSIAM